MPCELWFLNKAKSKQHENKVLMLDARGIYRKVTRKIFDFSPEQLANLTAIIWLYRNDSERFVALIEQHFAHAIREASASLKLLDAFTEALQEARKTIATHSKGEQSDAFAEFGTLGATVRGDANAFSKSVQRELQSWHTAKHDNAGLKASA